LNDLQLVQSAFTCRPLLSTDRISYREKKVRLIVSFTLVAAAKQATRELRN
jgi:hypothetical protein